VVKIRRQGVSFADISALRSALRHGQAGAAEFQKALAEAINSSATTPAKADPRRSTSVCSGSSLPGHLRRMVYGPIRAWLWSLFPTLIRYNLAVAGHITSANGWFGGLLPSDPRDSFCYLVPSTRSTVYCRPLYRCHLVGGLLS